MKGNSNKPWKKLQKNRYFDQIPGWARAHPTHPVTMALIYIMYHNLCVHGGFHLLIKDMSFSIFYYSPLFQYPTCMCTSVFSVEWLQKPKYDREGEEKI